MEKVKLLDLKLTDRVREDYGDVKELAQSIKDHGLLHPIVIDDDNNILVGGRRYTAFALLQRKEIPVTRFSKLPKLEQKKIELAENIHRKPLTWVEEITIREEIHELSKTEAKVKGEKWTTEDTAKLLHIDVKTVTNDLFLSRAVRENKSLLKETDKTIARGKARKIRDRKQREAIMAAAPSVDENVHLGDCLDVMKTIPSNSIDLILFDPPFGVNLDTTRIADSHEAVYTDSYQAFLDLLGGVMKEASRVMKDGAHCYIFFALKSNTIGEIMEVIHSNLDTADAILFWEKQQNYNPTPLKKYTINYEPIIFAFKGNEPRRLNHQSNAIFTHPTDHTGSKDHPAQKPIGLYKDLIELATIPGEVVLDPTAGSGMALVTAKQLGRKYVGIEKDPEWYKLIQYNLAQVGGE